MTKTVCIPKCGNVAIPMPPYPPFWNQVPPTPIDPVLTLICPVSPISAMCGTAPVQVSANGSLITATTTAWLDGTISLPVVSFTATSIKFTVDPTNELTPRIGQISLKDGAETAITTCPFEFKTAVLVPTISYIWPDMIGRSNPGELVTITGTNFDATSTVMRGVQPLPTTFVNATTLTITSTDVTATTGSFDVRVRNGPSGAYELSPTFVQASCALNPTCNLLVPNTTPAGGVGPFEVKFLGNNLGASAEILIDGQPVPSRWVSGGDVRFDVDPSTATPGLVLQVSVRLGHDHPEGHDNVTPAVAPLSLPFTFS